MEHPKTFRIDRGIGQYDFNDYYAVLGLPLTAESSLVRRRYLLIAKCLHPDVHGRSNSEKQVATQYLSKLVNPAYNVLSQERERTEYSAILKLLGKRLMKRNQKFSPQSEIAKKYLVSSKEVNYEQTVQEIAKVQYQNLEQALENIGLLSELNLVHILLQEGYSHSPNPVVNTGIKPPIAPPPNPSINHHASNNTSGNTGNTGINTGARPSSTYASGNAYQMRSESLRNASNTDNTSGNTSGNTAARSASNTGNTSGNTSGNTAARSASNTGNTSSNTNGNTAARSASQASNSQAQRQNQTGNVNQDGSKEPNDAAIKQYIRQAESYINQKLWTSALKELRSAIQLDCNNSKCHALLGLVYMNQKLSGMAKVSFQQALKLNPNEPLANQYIDQVGGTGSAANPAKPDPKAKNDKKSGFFGWLGGG
ncbi:MULTISPECIES: J domain-containing protein [Pseudanabaena]|uniref:Heat shock protein DnaJ domain protein n=2 Tax=Pseudanabaena TaxID=1152 RepID=L8N364_9CYAN|nr:MULTISPECIES: DnaJ domain-containing protein [Pseudanabaena]ELS34121.1 heat shock protein DnaJ domain protein [Pseudanabaena biceps PCC 7429]MDG3493710.1 DnaJ domain-containing protein [Pseudanabaena catenata USMAC16]